VALGKPLGLCPPVSCGLIGSPDVIVTIPDTSHPPIVVLTSLFALCRNTGMSPTARTMSAPQAPAPVLVELFTSEGCSSCPPADELLVKLQADQPIPGVQIIGLEEHVDYWNHDGWMDPYSRAEWTARQQDYTARLKGASPYTPQMVVDGQREFLGNNPNATVDAIRESAQQQKTCIVIAASVPSKGETRRFEVRVGNLPASSGQDKAEVWLVVAEEGLPGSAKAGENSGKSWEHAAIVRSMQKIGSAASSSEPFVSSPQIKLKSIWKKDNLRIVMFVQERKTRRVIGVATTKVAS
jgi:hypothetical protein